MVGVVEIPLDLASYRSTATVFAGIAVAVLAVGVMFVVFSLPAVAGIFSGATVVVLAVAVLVKAASALGGLEQHSIQSQKY